MSRSKRDILDTENMLVRLTHLLQAQGDHGTARADAEALRRISMTLHTWHELECNYEIAKGRREGEKFIYDKKGKTHINYHGGRGNTFLLIPDREAGAMKRLAKIMARYPKLIAYVQGDPRGCALYILKPGDVPDGEQADAYYSRVLAVHR